MDRIAIRDAVHPSIIVRVSGTILTLEFGDAGPPRISPPPGRAAGRVARSPGKGD
jgi:hypothetical protein